jgi:hypothetical protein
MVVILVAALWIMGSDLTKGMDVVFSFVLKGLETGKSHTEEYC